VEQTRAYYTALLAGRPIVPASHCVYLPQALSIGEVPVVNYWKQHL
jgi:hypothetical protein